MGTDDTFARPPFEQSRAQAPDEAAHESSACRWGGRMHAAAGFERVAWEQMQSVEVYVPTGVPGLLARCWRRAHENARSPCAGNNDGCSGARGTLHAKEYTNARWWGSRGAVRRACYAHRECTRNSRTVAAVGAPAFAQTRSPPSGAPCWRLTFDDTLALEGEYLVNIGAGDASEAGDRSAWRRIVLGESGVGEIREKTDRGRETHELTLNTKQCTDIETHGRRKK